MKSALLPLGIVDSSPIISLQRIGRLDLLEGHFKTLVAPPAVAREVGKLPDGIELWQPRPLDTAVPFPARLHPGEIEAITLGLQHPTARLVLDDDAARRFALGLGLDVTGVIGIVLVCRSEGRLDSVGHVLMALREAGARLSPKLIARALHLAGEAP